MNAPSIRDSGELAPGPCTTYDLIVCHDDRVVFHDHYATAEQRLNVCVGILTASDILADTITSDRAGRVHDLHHAHVSQWRTDPDSVVNAIAKLCRAWGIQVYVSTTEKRTAAPRTLYSVITEYGPGQMVAEHFADRAGRTTSLIERAQQFFAAPGHIPDSVLDDEQRLAALVATFLMPATVCLTESVLDEDHGTYRPAGQSLPIR
ncbi:hypothetical protein C8K30_1011023 [Promicromonospora sp. AC04]|uniref:hypothetical protein n=1 Tax=Promicromonospora sp. AC04 TaxID=2135723 RepID=UPI000D3C8BDF|nr:hypothetical protein [Promicromonospora sp. AC04]PUB32497.1 hypothetical protein C8K30_1011023 [Promicromonospora sp. AC04]